VPGHGPVPPLAARVNDRALLTSGLQGVMGTLGPHLHATSGDIMNRGNTTSHGDVRNHRDITSRTCHNVPMVGPRPLGTSMAGAGPGLASFGGRGALMMSSPWLAAAAAWIRG
jgi:hypothetical protein